MRPVAEEAVHPVDKGMGNTERVEFLDHLMALYGIKIRTEVDEEESAEIPGGLKVLQEGVEKACSSILCPPLGLVGKLVTGPAVV